MAGTNTVVSSNPFMRDGDSKITISWTSTAAGAASDDIASIYTAAQKLISYALPQPVKITGFLRHVETDPSAVVGSVPTPLYDIALNDANGMDICGNALADRSDTVTERVDFDPPIYIDTEISLALTNSGNVTKGDIILWITQN